MNNLDFQNNIKKWVSIDNQIKYFNDKIKLLREEKNNLKDNIIQHVNTNNLNNSYININDSKLNFVEVKQTQPLTIKYVEECLSNIIPNQVNVERIIDYIKKMRKHKLSSDIKRTYKEN